MLSSSINPRQQTVLKSASELKNECMQSAMTANLPCVDPFLLKNTPRLSHRLEDIVEHAAFMAHKTTSYLKELNFDGPVIFLGRDATPVAIAVSWCSEALGFKIPLRMMDISNKYFYYGWDSPLGGSTPKEKDKFITRLINDQISPAEARSSGLWNFFKQVDLAASKKILFIDNGVNGTLLSRLNDVLNLCNPELEIHNALLYYSGAMRHLKRISAIVEKQPTIPKKPSDKDYIALGEFSKLSVKIEGWPHPYPSLSHYQSIAGKTTPVHIPSSIPTSDGLIEANVDWEQNAIQHLYALSTLRKHIL